MGGGGGGGWGQSAGHDHKLLTLSGREVFGVRGGGGGGGGSGMSFPCKVL